MTRELLIEMIQERLLEEDCNAGTIFDNLESPQWPNLKFALECICEAIPKQNIQVLLFQYMKEYLDPAIFAQAEAVKEQLPEDPKGKAGAKGKGKEEEKKSAQ